MLLGLLFSAILLPALLSGGTPDLVYELDGVEYELVDSDLDFVYFLVDGERKTLPMNGDWKLEIDSSGFEYLRGVPFTKLGALHERIDREGDEVLFAVAESWKSQNSDFVDMGAQLGDLVVYAWIFGDEVKATHVWRVGGGSFMSVLSRVSRWKTIIPTSQKYGYPAIALVQDGEIVPINSSPEGIAASPWIKPEDAIDRISMFKRSKIDSDRVMTAAAGSGNLELLEALVEGEVKWFTKRFRKNLKPAIYGAVKAGQVEVLDYLLKQSPLFRAAIYSNEQERVGSIENKWGRKTATLYSQSKGVFYEAANLGHIDVLQKLIEIYPDQVDYKFKEEDSPIWGALDGRFLNVFNLLLSNGFRFELSETQQSKHAMEAMRSLNPDLAKLLWQQFDADTTYTEKGVTNMHFAARIPDIQLLEYLEASGVPLDQAKETGLTPLHYACDQEELANIRWFLDRGIGYSDDYRGKNNPIFYTIYWGGINSLKCLIEYGYTVDAVLENGQTPLMYALEKSKDDMFEYLLDIGSLWSFENEELVNHALDFVLRNDLESALKGVIDQGLPESFHFVSGWSLSFIAEYYEASNCLKLLEEREFLPGGKSLSSTSNLVKGPELVKRDPISLSNRLKRKSVGESVTVEGIVDLDGSFQFPKIVKGFDPEIDEALLSHTKTWRLKPAQSVQGAVPIVIAVPIEL
tara:strand:+ start:252 stop:2321 length:2070 start_codon:yes stop_codon:yes gene_type:complete